MDELTAGDKKLLAYIDKYGVSVLHILAEGDYPRFSYSCGLYKTYKHPEIIIVGLKQELSHSIINNIAEEIKNGKKYDANTWSAGILDGFKCYLIEVDRSNYYEYVGYNRWLYDGDNYPLLQFIYPTVKGIFPWEEVWTEDSKNLQPILGDLNMA